MHFVFGSITTALLGQYAQASPAQEKGHSGWRRSDHRGERGQSESGKASVNRNGKEYICFDAAICEKRARQRWLGALLILSVCVFPQAVKSAAVRKTCKQDDISLH